MPTVPTPSRIAHAHCTARAGHPSRVGFTLAAAEPLDGPVDDRVVAIEDLLPLAVAAFAQQSWRVDDVGEHHGREGTVRPAHIADQA